MKDIEKILEHFAIPLLDVGNGQKIVNGTRRLDLYEKDLNAIRELELMVVGRVGAERYGYNLNLIVNCDPSDNVLATPNEELAYIATADASTRIAAMIAVLEGE